MEKETNYTGFDMAKIAFSILIITLHLPLYESGVDRINYFRLFIAQYIARLGVPVFFVISGFFLGGNLNNTYNERTAPIIYIKRIVKLFTPWFLLYLPVIVLRGIKDYYGEYSLYQTILLIIQEIIFKCPAYLWYLVALIVAVYPTVLLYRKNKHILIISACLLYAVGCTGNTYLYFQPFNELWKPYLNIFLTTRNGLFFAFPYLTLGVFLYNRNINLSKKKILICCVFSYLLFATEVSFASVYFIQGGDCSMYFSMPVITVFLFYLFKALNLKISRQLSLTLRKMSTWVYCSQYFFITAVLYVSSKLGSIASNELVIWCAVSVLCAMSYMAVHLYFSKIEDIFT